MSISRLENALADIGVSTDRLKKVATAAQPPVLNSPSEVDLAWLQSLHSALLSAGIVRTGADTGGGGGSTGPPIG